MHQINNFISALFVTLDNTGYCTQNVNLTLWGLFLLLQLYSTVDLPYFCTYFCIDMKIIAILVSSRYSTAKSPGWSKHQKHLWSCCKTICCRRKNPIVRAAFTTTKTCLFPFIFLFYLFHFLKQLKPFLGRKKKKRRKSEGTFFFNKSKLSINNTLQLWVFKFQIF